MSRKLTPIRCTPQYYHKIWGGGHLAPTGGDKQIGEVWLLSALAGQETPTAGADYEGASLDALVARYGDRLLGRGQTARCGGAFPLLIKLLDAAADLSVQVHPSPEEGGKDEIWYFLETEPTSRICLGLTESMSADVLRSVIERAALMHYLHWEPVRPGEAIALPAGTIHALGAGSMLIEVQDTSDTTYRLYDYDRVDDEGARRTLHIEEALRSATLEPHRLDSRQLPLGTPRFVCHEVTATPDSSQFITTEGTSCAILVGISGSLLLSGDDTEPWQLAPHEALLLPAETLPMQVAPWRGQSFGDNLNACRVMIQIDDKVVSFEILEECFACDYAVCRGACCVHGDAGPPATERECRSYQRHLSLLEPHLAPEASELIHHQGVSYIDMTGERVLSIVNGENCAFTLHPTPPEGVRCAIEWYASTHPEVQLEKPISCRLYPIRVRQFKYFSSLHYDRWDICQAAVERGRKLGIKVYQFVREPLIAAFGAHFYDQLVEADKLLQEARCKEAEDRRAAKH